MASRSDILRTIGVVLLTLKFALIPVVFDPTSLTVFALPKTIVSESLSAGLVALLVLMALRDGVREWARNPVILAVGGFFLAYAVAAVFALDRYLAIFGSHDRLLGLLAEADMFVTTVALIVVARTEHFRGLITAALAAGVVACAYGFIQLAALDPLRWAQPSSRIFSTLGNATVLGHYLAVLAAGALALGALDGASGRERVVLVVLAVAFLAIGLVSGTRAVALALPVFLTLTALVVRRALAQGSDQVSVLRRAVTPLLALGLGFAALFVLFDVVQLYGGRLAALAVDPTSIGDDRSVAGRVAIYEVALGAFRDHPLTGVGPDNFEVAFPMYRPERFFAVTGVILPDSSAHSWLASLMSDVGAVGLIGFVFLLTVLVYVSRRRPTPLTLVGWALIVTYLSVGIVTVNHIATIWLFWVGVAAIGWERAPAVVSVRRLPGVTIAIPMLAALAWMFFSVPAFAASRNAQTTNGYIESGRYDRAVAAGRDAVSTDPSRAIYWHYLAVAYTRQDKFANARDAFLSAWKRAPQTVVYLTYAARNEVALAQTGDKSALPAALLHAVNAVVTDPNNPEAQFVLALAFAANGRYEEAVAASERGRTLDAVPQDIGAYEVASQSYLRASRPADAERWARDGLGITGVSGKAAVPIRLVLAQALVSMGRNADALAQLSLVTAVDPANAEAARILAQINTPRP